MSKMPQSSHSLNRAVLITAISSLVVILDYVTKKMIVSQVMLYESINVLPFLNIVHVQNKGAAFSMFSGLGNHYFIAISVIAILAIVLYISRLPKGLELYSLSMILGGAAGNLIDRIMIGKVTDFIDLFVGSWHWPAFNVADSALTVGITIYLIANIRHGRAAKKVS
jgi:signal peptidase II